MVHCCADYKATEWNALNHFVPAWSSANLGLEDWEVARRHCLDDICARKLTNAQMIKGVPAGCPDEVLTSLLDAEETLQAWEDMQERLRGYSLTAQEVPGDGNCALWSFLCLQRGKPAALLPDQPPLPSTQKVYALRRAAGS